MPLELVYQFSVCACTSVLDVSLRLDINRAKQMQRVSGYFLYNLDPDHLGESVLYLIRTLLDNIPSYAIPYVYYYRYC